MLVEYTKAMGGLLRQLSALVCVSTDVVSCVIATEILYRLGGNNLHNIPSYFWLWDTRLLPKLNKFRLSKITICQR